MPHAWFPTDRKHRHSPPAAHDLMRVPLSSAARLGALSVVGLLACDRPAGNPTSKVQVPVTLTAASAGDLIIYEARRDAYRRTLTAREKRGENIEAAERSALRELESLLRPIVGDFSAPWVKRRGRMNQTTLTPGSEDSGLPDGILYESRDSTIQVLVTTRDLMLSWVDSSTGQLKPGASLAAGKIVSLSPPAADAPRPWVAWLERR